MDKKKIIQKYLVDGKFQKKAYDRLALKASEASKGERDLSDFSTAAFSYVVPGYQAQVRNDNSIRGKADKKIEIIERTTTERLTHDLSESARNIFDSFPLAEFDKWRLKIEEDTLLVDYFGRDRIESGKRTSWTLTFESFRTGYFTRIRKKLKESVE